jgi:hypothetical protein
MEPLNKPTWNLFKDKALSFSRRCSKGSRSGFMIPTACRSFSGALRPVSIRGYLTI